MLNFPQLINVDTEVVFQKGSLSLHSTYFPIHHSTSITKRTSRPEIICYKIVKYEI